MARDTNGIATWEDVFYRVVSTYGGTPNKNIMINLCKDYGMTGDELNYCPSCMDIADGNNGVSFGRISSRNEMDDFIYDLLAKHNIILVSAHDSWSPVISGSYANNQLVKYSDFTINTRSVAASDVWDSDYNGNMIALGNYLNYSFNDAGVALSNSIRKTLTLSIPSGRYIIVARAFSESGYDGVIVTTDSTNLNRTFSEIVQNNNTIKVSGNGNTANLTIYPAQRFYLYLIYYKDSSSSYYGDKGYVAISQA